MKATKIIVAIALAVVMVAAMGITAFAATPDGKITVQNSATDKDYTLYKVFDATVSADKTKVSYTYTGTAAKWTTAGAGTYFDKDTNGTVTIKAAATSEGKLVDGAIAAIKALGTQVATKKGNGTTIEFTGLAEGYYYVTSSVGAVVTITTANPTVTIVDKNDDGPGYPEGEDTYKTVKNGTEYTQTASLSVGETAEFKVAFKATNYITDADKGTAKQVEYYTITDKPTALKLDLANAVVKVGTKTLTKNTEYTVDTSKNLIKITWKDAEGKTIYDSPVVVTVTYTAEVLAGEPTNDVVLAYKTIGGTSDEPFQDPKPEEDPEVKITNHKVTVTVKDNNGNLLNGATLTLYKNGTKVNLVKDGENYRPATADDKTSDYVSITGSSAVVTGLGNGNYEFKETATPKGYNKLNSQQTFTINDADATAEIVYQAGTELPATGSTGTMLFVLIGSLAIVAAGAVLVTNKRMSKEGF